MREITSCPSCASEKIEKVRRKWEGEYNGQTYTVENLEFYECPDCGEKVYDREAMKAIQANSPAFAKATEPK